MIDLAKLLLNQLSSQNTVVKLYNYVVDCIEGELSVGLRAENDWSINVKLACNCEYCKIANEFLYDNSVQNKTWSIIQAARTHIINIFNGLDLPVDISIEKKGSPHKLIMKKNSKLYLDAKKRFDELSIYYHKLQE